MTTLSIKTKIGFVVLGAVVGAGKIASYLSSKVWQVAFKSFSLTTSQPYSWLSRQMVTHSDNFPICFFSDENFCGSAAVAVKVSQDGVPMLSAWRPALGYPNLVCQVMWARSRNAGEGRPPC